MTTMAKTNGTTAARKNYSLASMADSNAIVRARNYASQTSRDFPRASVELAKAIALIEGATNTATAKNAVKQAERAEIAYRASAATYDSDLLIEIENTALTLCGVYAYLDATVDMWAAMRGDVDSATWTRKATAKTASYQFVIHTNGHKMFVTLNNTAALDWRKLDAKVDERLAKWEAKEAAKAEKAAAREKKAAARKAANAAKTNEKRIALAEKRLAAAQAALDALLKAA